MTKRRKMKQIALIVLALAVVIANTYLTIQYDAYLGFFRDLPATILGWF